MRAAAFAADRLSTRSCQSVYASLVNSSSLPALERAQVCACGCPTGAYADERRHIMCKHHHFRQKLSFCSAVARVPDGLETQQTKTSSPSETARLPLAFPRKGKRGSIFLQSFWSKGGIWRNEDGMDVALLWKPTSL